ncbi:MAG: hypothetical protein JSU81_03515 [Candidatus Coatesbacteria bacterium]|nr:MAG: hypothetical protein JSU81_03515 [Candidatus Coatesbacteria bacterium]
MQTAYFYGAVIAAAAVGGVSLWLGAGLRAIERKSLRVTAKAAAATSGGAIVVGAVVVGFQNLAWTGEGAILQGIGEVAILLAAVGLGSVGVFKLLE